jgi:competence protein ComEC
MRKLCIIIGIGISVLFILLIYLIGSLGDALLHIYYLNVGQGDAALIHTPANEYILVDGGPGQEILQRLGEVMPFYERTIDVIVLSHPHADHVDGLIEVLRRYDVRAVYFTGIQYNNPGYDLFIELIAEEGADIFFVGRGKDFRFGNVVIDTLYPFGNIQGREFSNINNSSIVLRMIFGRTFFYFGGDAEVDVEEELIKSGLDLHADIFKASHHGSRTANSAGLLTLIDPEFSVISCGEGNKFGHPHQETINVLLKRDVRIFRTDIDGSVEFISDGIKFWTHNPEYSG